METHDLTIRLVLILSLFNPALAVIDSKLIISILDQFQLKMPVFVSQFQSLNSKLLQSRVAKVLTRPNLGELESSDRDVVFFVDSFSLDSWPDLVSNLPTKSSLFLLHDESRFEDLTSLISPKIHQRVYFVDLQEKMIREFYEVNQEMVSMEWKLAPKLIQEVISGFMRRRCNLHQTSFRFLVDDQVWPRIQYFHHNFHHFRFQGPIP